jgi:CSLREA domain-containing protein
MAAVAFACVFPCSAAATTIPVTTTADVEAADGQCSLREAVAAANFNTAPSAGAGECPAGSASVPDEIDLGPGTFTISPVLALVSSMTVRGQGDAKSAATVIDAQGSGRVLFVSGPVVTVQGVTIIGGHGADGAAGADQPGGTGTGGAGSPGESGGGIVHSAGTLTLVDDRVVGNVAGAGGKGGNGTGDVGGAGAAGKPGHGGAGGFGGNGGGVTNVSGATLVIRSSTFSSNHSGAGGQGGTGQGGAGGAGGDAAGGAGTGGNGVTAGTGGAIYSRGPVTVSDTTFADNATGAGGKGGDGTGGAGAMSGAGGDGHGGNGGFGGWGGAIDSNGASDIRTSAFVHNATGRGGDAGVGRGDSGFASGSGGSGFGGTGGPGGRGGAALLEGPTQTQLLENVTFAQNSTGAGGTGGDAHKGHDPGINTLTIQRGAGGDGGSGGGLDQHVGTLTVAHATISGNSLGAAGAGGSGTGGSPGAPGQAGTGRGTFTISGATTDVQNSIVADPCAGTLTDQGHNLGAAGCLGGAGDPTLGPLQDNGGPTVTMALGAGSAAIDQVPATGAGCAPTDQRGAVRPGGTLCDIGAYEIAPPLATTGAASGVGESAASLNGTVEGRGLATSYHFDYGPTTDYGSTTPPASTSSAAGVPVAAALSGLTAGTTYHFRLVASSDDGTSTGADSTFTTTAPGTGNPGPDVTAPVVDQVTVKPKRFAAKKGTTFGYRVSEPAGATLAIQRGRAGLKLKGRCGAASARRRRAVVAQIKRRLGSKATPRRIARELRKARCIVYSGVGTLQQLALAGPNTLRFSGRLGTKALKPGGYRLEATARDAAGNVSKPAFAKFTVLRSK